MARTFVLMVVATLLLSSTMAQSPAPSPVATSPRRALSPAPAPAAVPPSSETPAPSPATGASPPSPPSDSPVAATPNIPPSTISGPPSEAPAPAANAAGLNRLTGSAVILIIAAAAMLM